MPLPPPPQLGLVPLPLPPPQLGLVPLPLLPPPPPPRGAFGPADVSPPGASAHAGADVPRPRWGSTPRRRYS